jgi:NADP-dependent 3-hydroxy acid dehydrogenase YdfG
MADFLGVLSFQLESELGPLCIPSQAGKFEDLKVDDYRRQFDTNAYGVIDAIQAVLPEVVKAKGQIAIAGSVNDHFSEPRPPPTA